MSINITQNTLDRRVVTDISTIRRELQDIRTKQLTGGAAIDVVALDQPVQTINFTSVGGGSAIVQQVNLPANAVDLNPFYMNFAYRVFIGSDNNDNYLWPNGSSLAGAYKLTGPLYIHWRRDQVLSDATTNSSGRNIQFYMRYGGQASFPAITVYLHTKLYTPRKLFT